MIPTRAIPFTPAVGVPLPLERPTPAISTRASSLTPAVGMPMPVDRPTPASSPEAAGKAFEGMFVSMFIKQMRQALPGDGLFGKDPSDALGGLFDHFMGEHIAQHGHLGVAAMIRHHLETRGPRT